MARFFVSRENHFHRVPVPAGFIQNPHCGEEHRHSALHVETPRARHNAILDREGALCRLAIREHRVEMSDQSDKRLRRVTALRDEKVPRLGILVKADFEARGLKNPLHILPDRVDPGLVFGSAVAVDEQLPSGQHGVSGFIHPAAERFKIFRHIPFPLSEKRAAAKDGSPTSRSRPVLFSL